MTGCAFMEGAVSDNVLEMTRHLTQESRLQFKAQLVQSPAQGTSLRPSTCTSYENHICRCSNRLYSKQGSIHSIPDSALVLAIPKERYSTNLELADLYEAWALYNFGRLCLMRIRRQIRGLTLKVVQGLSLRLAEVHLEPRVIYSSEFQEQV